MKKVHSTEQLFHLFCNMINADLEGFKTSSQNVYFENGTLYSYGAHYPMAKKYPMFTGLQSTDIILINSKKSSVTTQKHKSQIHSSKKPGQKVLYVPNIQSPKDPENQIQLMNDIVEACDSVLRRLKGWDLDTITRRVYDYNIFSDAFKLKRFDLPADFYTDLAILSAETSRKNEAKDKERYAKQDAERAMNRQKWASEVELWYSCKNTMNISSSYFSLNYDPVRVNGKIVETPRGAQVSLDEARQFCEALEKGQINIGDKISEFEVLAFQGTGENRIVEIGCHKINIKQAINAVLGA